MSLLYVKSSQVNQVSYDPPVEISIGESTFKFLWTRLFESQPGTAQQNGCRQDMNVHVRPQNAPPKTFSPSRAFILKGLLRARPGLEIGSLAESC